MDARRYRNPVHCLRLSVREEGARGLLRGLGATLAREVPGNALFFTVYEVRGALLTDVAPTIALNFRGRHLESISSNSALLYVPGHDCASMALPPLPLWQRSVTGPEQPSLAPQVPLFAMLQPQRFRRRFAALGRYTA